MTSEPRSLQFGLRKLLLWTAAIGLYLGLFRSLELEPASGAMLTVFVAIIIVLRLTVGWQATAIASLAGCVMGPLLCGILELTIRAVNWADNLMQGSAAESDEVAPRTNRPVTYSFVAVALLAALLGSGVPIVTIIDLWQEPAGSGIRPMGLPIVVLWHGFSTPAIASIFVVLAFRSVKDSTVPLGERAAVRSLAVLAAVLSLAPLLISTLGVHWVIQIHNLWLKP